MTPQWKYDRAHTAQVKLKLNLGTDRDILDRLAEVDNKQGYIKELIRRDIAMADYTKIMNTQYTTHDDSMVDFLDGVEALSLGEWIRLYADCNCGHTEPCPWSEWAEGLSSYYGDGETYAADRHEWESALERLARCGLDAELRQWLSEF